VLATKPVIEPEDLADTYAALRAHDPQWTAERIAGFDNRLIDQALKDARDLGIEAVDFRAGMLARKRAGELMFYHEDTHTAVPGNRAIAEILMQSVPRPGEPAVN
jgi:hypothetical protein